MGGSWIKNWTFCSFSLGLDPPLVFFRLALKEEVLLMKLVFRSHPFPLFHPFRFPSFPPQTL